MEWPPKDARYTWSVTWGARLPSKATKRMAEIMGCTIVPKKKADGNGI